MVLLLDLDRTLNCLQPAGIRSIRELAPPALAEAGGQPLWSWLIDHLSKVDYPINKDALAILEQLSGIAPIVVINTGRPEGVREITADWLARYIKVDYLLMRGSSDYRPTVQVKRDNLVERILLLYRSDDILAFEDNVASVRMYREAGIRTFSAPEIWGELIRAVQSGVNLMEALSTAS